MWLKCMENMINVEKIDFFVEVSYGDMLSKFSKLINRRILSIIQLIFKKLIR